MIVDAILLGAGSIVVNGSKVAKATVQVAGKPMIDWVIGALDQAAGVGRVVMLLPAGEESRVSGDKVDLIIPAGDSIVGNVSSGMAALEAGEGSVLLISSDIPLITAEAIDDFLRRCRQFEADICYPIVRIELVDEEVPGTKRTSLKLLDGRYTGGNMILMRKAAFERAREMGEKIVARRKSPFRLVMMLGLGFVLRMAFGRLSVEGLEKKAGDLLGLRVAAIRTPFPAVGVDIDKESDLSVAEAVLEKKFVSPPKASKRPVT